MTDPTTNDWAEVGLDENRLRELLAAAFEAHPRQAEIAERRARVPTARCGDDGELVISLATPAWEARGDGDHHQPLFMPSTSTGCRRRTRRELMEAAAPPGGKGRRRAPQADTRSPYRAKEKSAACRQAARRHRDPGGGGSSKTTTARHPASGTFLSPSPNTERGGDRDWAGQAARPSSRTPRPRWVAAWLSTATTTATAGGIGGCGRAGRRRWPLAVFAAHGAATRSSRGPLGTWTMTMRAAFATT